MRTYARIVSTTIAGILILFGASTARAQDERFTVALPFEFTVGGANLPAGSYDVSRWNSEFLLVRGDHTQTVILAERSDGTARTDKPRLVFNRYGDRYYLRQIQFESSTELSLPATRGEREAGVRRADRSTAPETVVVVVEAK